MDYYILHSSGEEIQTQIFYIYIVNEVITLER